MYENMSVLLTYVVVQIFFEYECYADAKHTYTKYATLLILIMILIAQPRIFIVIKICELRTHYYNNL